MQIINGYDQNSSIRFVQRLRLYNLSRPAVKQWRAARHGKQFLLDQVDRWVLNNLHPTKLTAVDCAGWYFRDLGIDTECFESDDIAKVYNPDCFVEYDIFTHRPTYVDNASIVLFKYPWFLKYAKFESFVNFLNIWAQSTVVLNFDPVYIQHNHLKYKLVNLVRQNTDVDILEVNSRLWTINKQKSVF